MLIVIARANVNLKTPKHMVKEITREFKAYTRKYLFDTKEGSNRNKGKKDIRK